MKKLGILAIVLMFCSILASGHVVPVKEILDYLNSKEVREEGAELDIPLIKEEVEVERKNAFGVLLEEESSTNSRINAENSPPANQEQAPEH